MVSVTSHEHTVIYSMSRWVLHPMNTLWFILSRWVLHPMNTLWSILCHDECYIPWTHCNLFCVMMSVTSHEHTVICSMSSWVLYPMNTLWSVLGHDECYISWTQCDLCHDECYTSCYLFCHDECYISCDLFSVRWVLHPVNTLWSIYYVMMGVTSQEHAVIYSMSRWVIPVSYTHLTLPTKVNV